MTKARQVILGNSAAALGAVRAIREVDGSCSITLVSAERCNAYSPVLLTYYLQGKISRRDLFITDSKFYKLHSVQTELGNKAIDVDPFRQAIYLEDGTHIKYDNLLIATGASPVELSYSEGKPDNVFFLRTVEDADNILECARSSREVIVVGAGLIGLQVVDALFKKGLRFTIVERSTQLLPNIVDADCAAIIQNRVERHGVQVILGRKIKEARTAGRKTALICSTGERLLGDMIIVGMGLRPNIELLKQCDVKVNKGILVDDSMRTNFDNIFAAGDVSQGKNLVTGGYENLPNWPNACNQGRTAGLNMAGCQMRYEGLSEAVSTIFGLTFFSIGQASGHKRVVSEEVSFPHPLGQTYRKFVLMDNRIVGATLLGGVQDAGIIKSLIKKRIDVTGWKEKMKRTSLSLRSLLCN